MTSPGSEHDGLRFDVGPLGWREAEEVHDGPQLLSRRQALELGAIAGLWLSLRLGGSRPAHAATLSGAPPAAPDPSLFVGIEPSGTVRLVCHRSEMGQHIWTSVAQLLAEELEADWTRIVIVQAEGHPRYGDQNTDGSRSIRRNFDRLLKVGATMRTMLEQAAAARWNVPVTKCRAREHAVEHVGSRQRLEFGELANEASQLSIPTMLKLKERRAWRLVGQPIASLTVPEVVHGRGTFGADVRLPGMLYGVVARPPVLFGTVAAMYDGAAQVVPGVVAVVQLSAASAPAGFSPLGGVAVVARDTWAAIKGRKRLKIEWKPGANGRYDSHAFAETLLERVRVPGKVHRRRGDTLSALATAKTKVSAEYYVPHLAHAPMEPPVATARWNEDGTVEVWTAVQAPQEARKAVAEACDVDIDRVTIHVTWLGGGFGRKSKADFAVEAALIARAVERPVQVVWTREDDLRNGYYHAVSAQRVEAALDERGTCVAWLHRTAFPAIGSTFSEEPQPPSEGELRLGLTDLPFAVPNLQIEAGEAVPAHVRIGWLRSVANIYHAFAVGSCVAELAEAASRDPKEFLLELIGEPRRVDPTKEGATYDNYGESLERFPIDTGRLRGVIERAAAMAGWGRTLQTGHGLGIAAHRSFVSYVATVVEVSVDSASKLRIEGVWSAIDAGTVVNPKHVAAQVEGGTLFGFSHALYGEITMRDGAVEQHNFSDFRLLRIHEAPRTMAVEIVPSTASAGGVGEVATPPSMPALVNAIAAATGRRYRSLPIFGPGERDGILPAPRPPGPATPKLKHEGGTP